MSPLLVTMNVNLSVQVCFELLLSLFGVYIQVCLDLLGLTAVSFHLLVVWICISLMVSERELLSLGFLAVCISSSCSILF